MQTRCKMMLRSIEHFGYGSAKANFTCEYDEDLSKEDAAFSKYTPNGKAEFDINNNTVIENLKPGKTYYFDISEVLEPVAE